jgi:hypothetical protein
LNLVQLLLAEADDAAVHAGHVVALIRDRAALLAELELELSVHQVGVELPRLVGEAVVIRVLGQRLFLALGTHEAPVAVGLDVLAVGCGPRARLEPGIGLGAAGLHHEQRRHQEDRRAQSENSRRGNRTVHRFNCESRDEVGGVWIPAYQSGPQNIQRSPRSSVGACLPS